VQNILSMEIVGSLSENGFSLDELVLKTKQLFEQQGMSGFVALMLSLMDEHLCLRLVCGKSLYRGKRCCCNPRYEFASRPPQAGFAPQWVLLRFIGGGWCVLAVGEC
jgi:hypothetical protein